METTMTAIEIRHRINLQFGFNHTSEKEQQNIEFCKEVLLQTNLLLPIKGFTLGINHGYGQEYILITVNGLHDRRFLGDTLDILMNIEGVIGVHFIEVKSCTLIVVEVDTLGIKKSKPSV